MNIRLHLDRFYRACQFATRIKMDLITLLDTSLALQVTLTIVLGLSIGSFINVVIHRLPIILERRWQREWANWVDREPLITEIGKNRIPDPETYNLFVPRSRCTTCGASIATLHNIPLISWLSLRGCCAHCKGAISLQYPAVELLTAFLSAIVVLHFGFTSQAAVGLVLTWALIALCGIDYKTALLPDDITLPLLWLGLLCNTWGVITDLHSAVIGAVGGYWVLWFVYQLFRLVTGKEGMGHGDFKLLAALGAWLGWQQLPLIILFSSLLGAVAGISLIAIHGRDWNAPIPFGPYLAVAGWVSLLWGEQLMHYYLHILTP